MEEKQNSFRTSNTFAIFNQPLIRPQMTQIIADKTEEMASNLCKSVVTAQRSFASNRQVDEAVDFARKLLVPTTQPQPEALVAPLQAAIQAWELGQTELTAASLHQAAALAEPLGFL